MISHDFVAVPPFEFGAELLHWLGALDTPANHRIGIHNAARATQSLLCSSERKEKQHVDIETNVYFQQNHGFISVASQMDITNISKDYQRQLWTRLCQDLVIHRAEIYGNRTMKCHASKSSMDNGLGLLLV